MTTNERLRGSMLSARVSSSALAERIGVDPKTVERWITKGRLPHRSHRAAAAGTLHVDEGYLWPDAMTARPTAATIRPTDLVEVYPTRASVPHDVWLQLIADSREALDILTYSGTFLFEQLDVVSVLRTKSAAGVRCRFLIGDESADAVCVRAEEEGTTGGLQGRIQLHRRYLRDVVGLPGVEIRTHGTTLYNSLFRFDPGQPDVGALHALVRRRMEIGHPDEKANRAVTRIDYYQDPDAPMANSIVPSTTAAVRDEHGRLLMIHKVDNDKWALPGGGMELGESVADAAVREVREETGLTVEITGLVGVYSDPGHVMAYDDGEVRQEFSVCFHARPVGGSLREDGTETKAVIWVETDAIDRLTIHPSMRRRIDDAVRAGGTPQIA